MSFDTDDFIGLLRGGAPGTPADTAEEYAKVTGPVFYGGGAGPHSGDPDEIDFGAGPPGGDYIGCYHIGPEPPGDLEFHWDPGQASLLPADLHVAPADTHGLPPGSMTMVDWGDWAIPPDYVTVYARMGSSLSTPSDLVAAQLDCPTIILDPDGNGIDDYIQTAPSHSADIEWSMAVAMGSSMFVPDQYESGGTFDADGQMRPLQGYLKRSSTAYTGDPDNTASDYLWPAGELGDIVFTFDGILHKADVPNYTIILRPFWARRRGFICLV